MSFTQKQIFQEVKNVKNSILTLNFTFSGQLGSLITSKHAFRSSWNFQKLMKVRYTLDLRTFQVVEISNSLIIIENFWKSSWLKYIQRFPLFVLYTVIPGYFHEFIYEIMKWNISKIKHHSYEVLNLQV